MRQSEVAAESGLPLLDHSSAVNHIEPSNARKWIPRWPRGRGRWLILVGAIALVSLVLGAAMWRDRGASATTFTCDEPSFDFGKVSPDTAATLHHDFKLTNRTGRPIRIVEHKASCGCTTAVPPSAAVAPGDAIVVPITVNWGSRSGNESSQVVLTTESGGTTSKLTLRTSAFVDNPVLITPRLLDFGEVPPGPAPERIIEVRRISSGSPLHIREIEITDPRVKIRRVSSDNRVQPLTGDEGKFGVRIDAPDNPETFFADVLFSFSETQVMRVAVQAHAVGAIRVTPSSVLFDWRDRDRAGTESASVRVEPQVESDPADILEVNSEFEAQHPAPVRALVSQTHVGNRTSATLTLTCTAPEAGIILGRLRIRLGQHETSVPVIILGRAKNSAQ